jgi:replication-associated recombination protein RarA
MRFPHLHLHFPLDLDRHLNANVFHKEIAFERIEGYDDIKSLIRRVLDSGENYNLLFVGPPASSKTLFLQEILDTDKSGVLFDATNTTNRILDVLEEKRPKIILIDELDKMGRTFQNQLLNFLESGRVKVDQQHRSYDFTIKGVKVFATANDVNRLSKPLRSRFRCLHLPRYSEEQFLQVSVKVLSMSELSVEIAHIIGKAVWDRKGDIRDVQSVGKLVRKNDGPEEVERILATMTKYGQVGT